MASALIHLPEPELQFRYGQALEDPRDGLTLFGPIDKAPRGIQAGVIGTADGLAYFNAWSDKVQGHIPPYDAVDEHFYLSHPPYPGFQAAFRTTWTVERALTRVIGLEELTSVYIGNRYERVFRTVKAYAEKIIAAEREEDVTPNIWFVIVPDDVYKYCRPESRVAKRLAIPTSLRMSPRLGHSLNSTGTLFAELLEDATPYQYEPHFHNQLKSSLLNCAPIQIIRESTIAHDKFLTQGGKPKRNLDSLQPNIAWNLTTTAYYKAGGRPWKMAAIRKGVCYIGLVFKKDNRNDDPRSACCAAQMFLDSGDGVVFKGDLGPWYSPENGEYHLSAEAAFNLVSRAIQTYVDADKRLGGAGDPPKELFLHGRVWFNAEEWRGFCDVARSTTNVVGIQIRPTRLLKLYRDGNYPVIRGLAFVENPRKAYLWTNGFTPRIQNYIGKEVPNPLSIKICRGDADIEVVLKDIMALTKLNYNNCKFANAAPVTLRFADAVGEILTAGPTENPPLSFRYYI